MKIEWVTRKLVHGVIIGILAGWGMACSPVPQSSSFVSPAPPQKKYHPASPPTYYVMRPGDTLTQVSRQFEVSVQELQELNQIADPANMPIGTKLLIPAKKSDGVLLSSSTPDSVSSFALFMWPVDRPDISSPFGKRRSSHHDGLDLRAPHGTPIHAAANGTVKVSGWMSGYGHVVVIQHNLEMSTLYGHNSVNLVTPGDEVRTGQIIARIGKTGNATGNHVHFEVRIQNKPVDPQKYLPPLPDEDSFKIAGIVSSL